LLHQGAELMGRNAHLGIAEQAAVQARPLQNLVTIVTTALQPCNKGTGIVDRDGMTR
jgi:hypothetical protein